VGGCNFPGHIELSDREYDVKYDNQYWESISIIATLEKKKDQFCEWF
jgi:hypothetical protein